MVHQTMPIKIRPAPRASNSIKVMGYALGAALCALIVGSLGGCASVSLQEAAPSAAQVAAPAATPAAAAEPARVIGQARSRWVAVPWSSLPGWEQDNWEPAWRAWQKSCERAATMPAVLSALCPQVRALAGAERAAQSAWMQRTLQPYRVESLQGETQGLLTGYYEPLFEASRTPSAAFSVPLYGPPVGLVRGTTWYTRQEIETLPEARSALKGRVIAYLADPIDALVLQIQGSGRIRLQLPDGSARTVRLGFAGTNEQPYQSIGKWLLEQGLTRDATWPGIKDWLARNPQRQQELLWRNPRMVFFKEEPLAQADAPLGPRGAQGVALTPGRSIAVDPGSMPYGTPVWISSAGGAGTLQQLVLAQDTGSAIVGAVRADFFAGAGAQAGELAGRLKQPLQMWVLWPRSIN